MNFRKLVSLGAAYALLAPSAAMAQTYLITDSASPWVDIASIPGVSGLTQQTRNAGGNDDGAVTGITIPFGFNFLGDVVTTVHASTNGFVTFDTAGATAFGNRAVGTSGAPNRIIAPWWDDMVAGTADFVMTAVVGAAPNRQFVLEGSGLTAFGGGGMISWQVWLYEGAAGRFDVRINGTPNTAHSATVGYEGPNGSPNGAFLSCQPACGATDFTGMLGRVYSAFIANDPELTGDVGAFARGAFPGDSANGQVRLRNLGIDDATDVVYHLYLSSDSALDTGDTLVGTGTVATVLGGDQPVTVTATVTVPANQPPGDFTLLMFVDAPNRYTEANEGDNVVAGSAGFATAYDLEPTSVTSPGGANPGDQVTFDVTITNNGVPRVGETTIQVWASEDAIFSRADDDLVVDTTVTLTGQNVESFQVSATLPNLTPGTYLPIALVDSSEVLIELNELNNTFTGNDGFPSGPDFVVTQVTTPVQVTAGATFEVRTTLGSAAVAYSGDVDYCVYVSADETFDASGDIRIGTYTATFAGEMALEDVQNPTFPGEMVLMPGTYFVIAVADCSNAIAEVDEMNNIGATAQPLSNAPDFGAGMVTFSPQTTSPGSEITVTAQLRSVGVPFVGMLPYRVYLSLDDQFDPGDERIFDGVQFVAGLSTTNVEVMFNLPLRAPIAAVHVIVVADPDNVEPESVEDNNWGASQGRMTINGADLFISSITGSEFGFIGLDYPVELLIQNDGIEDARNFQYAVYVSENEVISVTDTQVFVSATATIAAGGQATFNADITLPTFTSTQTVWIGAIVDIFSRVAEDRETNNIRRIAHPVSVVFPIPDLAGSVVETATSAAAGEQLAITRLLRNDGVADADNFSFTYYLSSNPTISTDDVAIGTFTASLMSAADDFAIDLVQVPANVIEGRYYVGFLIDPDEQVEEISETNNSAVGMQIDVFDAAIQFRTDRLPDATLGVPYEVGVYAAGGAVGRVWSVSAGALPTNVSIEADSGIISGTPTEEGLFEFSLRAASGTGFADKAFSLRVLSPSLPLTLVGAILPTAVAGRPYETQIVAVGGQPPYDFAAIASVPDGLELEAETGLLTGTPAAPGNFRFAVRVRDALGNSASRELALNIINPNQSVTIRQIALPDGTVGQEYCEPDEIQLEATGGIPPYEWAILGDGISGLTLTSTTGSLCGIPARAGSFSFVVRAQDQGGLFDTAIVVLEVDDGTELAISTTALDDASIGTAYSAKLTAIRGDPDYSWSLADGALPAGLIMDAATGEITGLPTTAGAFAFVVQVVDQSGRVDVRPLSIIVIDPSGTLDPADDGSCGCSTTPGSAPVGSGSVLSLLALLGLILLRRKRTATLIAALTVLMVGSAAFAQSTPVPGTPFQIERTTETYQDLTSPNVLITGRADTNVSTMNLPFTFKYYDDLVDEVTVGVNGALLMGSGSINDFNPTPGSTGNPNGYIAPFWDDLFINNGQPGQVSFKVFGVAPQRRVTFEWKDIDRFGSSIPHMNFQLTLHEGPSGRITIHYGDIGNTTSLSGTMAMEDLAGMRAIRFDPANCSRSCNHATLVSQQNQKIQLVQDPGVELIALGIEGPEFGFLGAPMPIQVTLGNLHGAAIGPFTFSVLVSRTQNLSGATSIFTSSPVTFGPFQIATTIVEATPSMSLPEGEYYLGVVVDSGGDVMEVSEDNNQLASATRVRILQGKADLRISSVTTDVTAANAGDPVTVFTTVENVGAQPLSGAEIAVMLSTNPAISPQDVQLDTFTADLGPGETLNATTTVSLPAAIDSGTFYIGAFADPQNTIDELSESNNARASFRALSITGGTLAILTNRLPQANLGDAYNARLAAAGGDDTYTWEITAGRLPMGIGIVPATGELFGRPQMVESQSFTVQVTSAGQSVSKQLVLNVVDPTEPLTIVTRIAPPATVGQEYAFQLSFTGGTQTSSPSWAAQGTPAGLNLSTDGILSGTPESVGDFAMAVTLSDGTSTATREVQISVRDIPNLLINTIPAPTGTLGADYTQQFTAIGGVPPLTWLKKSGNFPRGLELSTSGELTGAPMQVGRFRVEIEVRDAATGGLSATDSNNFDIVIEDTGGFTITTTSLDAATVDVTYDVDIETDGGMPPFDFKVVQGRLPPGLNSETVAQSGLFKIFGNPTEVGNTNLLLEVTDGQGRIARRAYVIVVAAAGSTPTTMMPADDGGCSATHTGGEDTSTDVGLLAALFAGALLFRRKKTR